MISMHIDIMHNIYHANAPLRIWCLERVDVVDERWFGSDFKVADNRIALAAQVHHVRIGIVEGKHDAVRCVQFHHDDRVV